ncbi:integrase [Rouxiella silvae]|uniref:Integrase n=1 Tax=Rouxiella silvae TaxID=1646373 RepID=A0ABX3U6Y1_9GAMM|nr:integrase [Rouxiella silvae]
MATGGRWGDTLQRISGHANIQQTMTYAHFAHDLLEDAVTLNPIAGRSL